MPSRRALKNAAYGALNAAGLAAFARRRNRRRVPVLMYHGVTEEPRAGVLNAERNHLRADRFERHLQILAAYFRVIPLSQLVAALRDGGELPENCAVLTFDDGYRNNYTAVFPRLQKFGMPATFYIPVDFVERGETMWVDRLACAFHGTKRASYTDALGGRAIVLDGENARAAALLGLKARLKKMSDADRRRIVDAVVAELGGPFEPPALFSPMRPEELRELAQSPLVEIGSHSCSHPPLDRMPAAEARREIVESKARLEALTERAVESFSYPHGIWNAAVAGLVKEAGYGSAVVGGLKMARAGSSPYEIERLSLTEEDGDGAVEATLSGLRELALKLRGVNS